MPLTETREETVMTEHPTPGPDLFPLTSPDFPPPTERLSEVDVTPAIARAWLRRNTHNRLMKRRTLVTFTRMMKDGKWTQNGDAIRFSWPVNEDGERDDVHGEPILLDGQTRLQSVINSNTRQRFVVITDLDPKAQKTIDAGALRSISDNFAMDGYKNRHVLAAGISIAMRVATGDLANRNVRYGTPEVEDWLAAHPEFTAYVDAAVGTWRNYDVSAAPLAFCMWRLAQVDADAAHQFFEDWRTSRTGGEDDPLSTLITRVRKSRGTIQKQHKLDQYEQVAFILITWNARQRGQRMTSLLRASRFGRVRIPEPVPPGAPADHADHIPTAADALD